MKEKERKEGISGMHFKKIQNVFCWPEIKRNRSWRETLVSANPTRALIFVVIYRFLSVFELVIVRLCALMQISLALSFQIPRSLALQNEFN